MQRLIDPEFAKAYEAYKAREVASKDAASK
jgi:hypothetical protein